MGLKNGRDFDRHGFLSKEGAGTIRSWVHANKCDLKLEELVPAEEQRAHAEEQRAEAPKEAAAKQVAKEAVLIPILTYPLAHPPARPPTRALTSLCPPTHSVVGVCDRSARDVFSNHYMGGSAVEPGRRGPGHGALASGAVYGALGHGWLYGVEKAHRC